MLACFTSFPFNHPHDGSDEKLWVSRVLFILTFPSLPFYGYWGRDDFSLVHISLIANPLMGQYDLSSYLGLSHHWHTAKHLYNKGAEKGHRPEIHHCQSFLPKEVFCEFRTNGGILIKFVACKDYWSRGQYWELWIQTY